MSRPLMRAQSRGAAKRAASAQFAAKGGKKKAKTTDWKTRDSWDFAAQYVELEDSPDLLPAPAPPPSPPAPSSSTRLAAAPRPPAGPPPPPPPSAPTWSPDVPIEALAFLVGQSVETLNADIHAAPPSSLLDSTPLASLASLVPSTAPRTAANVRTAAEHVRAFLRDMRLAVHAAAKAPSTAHQAEFLRFATLAARWGAAVARSPGFADVVGRTVYIVGAAAPASDENAESAENVGVGHVEHVDHVEHVEHVGVDHAENVENVEVDEGGSNVLVPKLAKLYLGDDGVLLPALEAMLIDNDDDADTHPSPVVVGDEGGVGGVDGVGVDGVGVDGVGVDGDKNEKENEKENENENRVEDSPTTASAGAALCVPRGVVLARSALHCRARADGDHGHHHHAADAGLGPDTAAVPPAPVLSGSTGDALVDPPAAFDPAAATASPAAGDAGAGADAGDEDLGPQLVSAALVTLIQVAILAATGGIAIQVETATGQTVSKAATVAAHRAIFEVILGVADDVVTWLLSTDVALPCSDWIDLVRFGNGAVGNRLAALVANGDPDLPGYHYLAILAAMFWDAEVFGQLVQPYPGNDEPSRARRERCRRADADGLVQGSLSRKPVIEELIADLTFWASATSTSTFKKVMPKIEVVGKVLGLVARHGLRIADAGQRTRLDAALAGHMHLINHLANLHRVSLLTRSMLVYEDAPRGLHGMVQFARKVFPKSKKRFLEQVVNSCSAGSITGFKAEVALCLERQALLSQQQQQQQQQHARCNGPAAGSFAHVLAWIPRGPVPPWDLFAIELRLLATLPDDMAAVRDHLVSVLANPAVAILTIAAIGTAPPQIRVYLLGLIRASGTAGALISGVLEAVFATHGPNNEYCHVLPALPPFKSRHKTLPNGGCSRQLRQCPVQQQRVCRHALEVLLWEFLATVVSPQSWTAGAAGAVKQYFLVLDRNHQQQFLSADAVAAAVARAAATYQAHDGYEPRYEYGRAPPHGVNVIVNAGVGPSKGGDDEACDVDDVEVKRAPEEDGHAACDDDMVVDTVVAVVEGESKDDCAPRDADGVDVKREPEDDHAPREPEDDHAPCNVGNVEIKREPEEESEAGGAGNGGSAGPACWCDDSPRLTLAAKLCAVAPDAVRSLFAGEPGGVPQVVAVFMAEIDRFRPPPHATT
ncbi:hypothetical protein H9P43_002791 [Blastocladiella emersonii ATCC 22665]|nr:hypothetical protein H9P43_002791 [Blastocladiella emersonii ATCC 22665]